MDASSSTRIDIEPEDRILSLPRSIVDVILGCMPTKDKVRTSILSKRWRFIWAENPVFVIDKQFWSHIRHNRSQFEARKHFVHSVDKLLLQHKGPILRFVLEVPNLFATDYYNLDLWLRFLVRQGVQNLTLNNSSSVSHRVPSCIFSCPTLKILTISNCIFIAAAVSEGLMFPMLTQLVLSHVTIDLSVLYTPKLVSLHIKNCHGVHQLSVIAPRLSSLALLENDRLHLSDYMLCANLSAFYVALSNGVVWNLQNERITLTKLCSLWPKIRTLKLDASFLKYIVPAADNVPSKFLAEKMNSLNILGIFQTCYDFEEISRIVELIQAFPKVTSMAIWGVKVRQDGDDDDIKAVEYLEAPNLLRQSIYGLRAVKMACFRGLRAELLLIKLILANSPSLERILIAEKQKLDTTRRLEASKQLLRFPRASSKAVVVYLEG